MGSVLLGMCLAACMAPPDFVEESWQGASLRSPGGAVTHVLRENGDALQLGLPGEPGDYRVEVWGHASPTDGTPGVLEVRDGGRVVGRLSVAEGGGRRHWVHAPLSGAPRLVFANDHYDASARPPLDRNVFVERVRISQGLAPARGVEAVPRPRQSEERAERLRASAKHLVFVSIDTLRSDRLGVYGHDRDTSPHLDALAQRGVVFEQAVSASHWTLPSHGTLFTGLHPHQHGAVDRPSRALAQVPTIATVLADAGFTTRASAAGIWVDEAHGFARGFERFETGRAPANLRFERACDMLQDPGERLFLFVHSFQVHEPLDPPQAFDRWSGDGHERWRLPLTSTWLNGIEPSEQDLEHIRGLYDGEIAFTDHALGGFLACLDESGLAQDTLVVVTSDHGEAFMEHGTMGHGELYPEHLRVPLIMAHPVLHADAEPRVSVVAPAVDVLPTILEILGVTAPELPGHSLVWALAGSPKKKLAIAHGERGQWAAVDRGGVYMQTPGAPDRWYPRADPYVDLSGEAPGVASRLSGAIERVRNLPQPPPGEPVRLEPADTEALRVLGYVE